MSNFVLVLVNLTEIVLSLGILFLLFSNLRSKDVKRCFRRRCIVIIMLVIKLLLTSKFTPDPPLTLYFIGIIIIAIGGIPEIHNIYKSNDK